MKVTKRTIKFEVDSIHRKWWWLNGCIHRSDGPAYTNSDGSYKGWYLNSKFIKCEDKKMIINIGEFVKKNGEKRTMRFVKITDMTDEQKDILGLMEEKERKVKTLAPGSETVYDVDARDFRVFNWSSVIGEVQKQELEVEIAKRI
jgi:hypothetical protein